MKNVLFLIIISLFFVGCNSDEPKLGAIGNISSGSTTAPYITNITVPVFKTYIAGETMNFDVTFNKNVVVTGLPRIVFIADTGSVGVNYLSGSGTNTLHFSLTLVTSVIDADGITLSQSLNLNGGTIFDAETSEAAILTLTPPDTTGILVNTGDPQIISITPPADATYTIGQNARFVVNFDARVCPIGTPKLPLTVGAATRYAVWVDEGICSKNLKFDYVVPANDLDNNGIQLISNAIDLSDFGTAMRDMFANNATVSYTAATYANVKVDGTPAPSVIISQQKPADKTYKHNENLDFVVTFNEAVTVTGGPPSVELSVGGTPRLATYVSGSGTSSLTFRYTPPLNDLDVDGITVTDFIYNGASIKNAFNVNASSPTLGAWPSLANVKVDSVYPTEASRSSPSNGLRLVNNNISYSVNFSEPVVVTGYPRFAITLTTGTVYANYSSGSGTSTLNFNYSVLEGDEDLDGIVTGTTLQMNGGSIADAAGNVHTPGAHAWPGYTVTVDAKNPQISSIVFTSAKAYKPGETIALTVVWSEPVTYTGSATLNFTSNTGGTVTFTQTGLFGASLLMNHTVSSGYIDYDGLTVTGNLLGITGVTDGIGRTPATLAAPTPTNKVYLVPTEVAKWYDLSNTITIGGATTIVTQFKDIVTAATGTVTGTIPLTTSAYQPPLKYASFSGTQKITYGGLSLNYFVAVIDTTGSPSGPLLETDSGSPSPYLVMDPGVFKAPPCTIAGCYYRDGTGTWIPVNIFTKFMMTYTTNTIKIIAVKYPSSFNNYRIGSTFTGGVHEFFFINATVDSELVITDLINHLQTKYGVTY